MYQFLPSSNSSLNMATSKYKKMNDKPSWQPQWMKEFLEAEIPRACENCADLRFVILIDALDECTPESKDGVMDFLVNLLSVQKGPQLCVSCARWPGYFAEKDEVDVASNNNKDIASFVERKLSILSLKTRVIQTDITQRAKGMFSWAKIACNKVMRLHKDGESVLAIRQAIESLPEELMEMYLETIKEIKPEDVHATVKLFRWICFATRSLTVSELQDAIVTTPDMKETSIEEIHKSKDFRQDQDEMSRAIHHLSAGLAETFRSSLIFGGPYVKRVQLIHGSVHEFLLSRGFKELEDSTEGSCSDYWTEDTISSGHFYLSRSCIRYLSMEERRVWTSEAQNESLLSFPLLKYATASWLFHTEQVERAKRSQEDVLHLLQWPSTDIFTAWVTFHNIIINESFSDRTTYPRCKPSVLHVLARHGLVSLLEVILSSNYIKGNNINVTYQAASSSAVDGHQDRAVKSSFEVMRVNADE